MKKNDRGQSMKGARFYGKNQMYKFHQRLATPPFGLVLFAVCGISRVRLTKVSIVILPFLTAEVIVLLLITYVPFITMYFPRLLGFA